MTSPAPTSSQVPKKGILKKPQSSAVPAPPPSEATPRPLEQQIAIEQAKLLQRQRAEEIDWKPPVPIDTFERLSQFPRNRGPDISAGSPSPDDAREFLEALEGFLPREYQDLIDERNCLGSCGYALCPRPRRNHRGEFKILPTGIAKVADLNMWCSAACARRALFIKVQLENPSYVKRDGQMVVKIELREEREETEEPARRRPERNPGTGAGDGLANAVGQLEIDKKKQTTRDAAALAVERGDAARPARQLDVAIREKDTVGLAQPPDLAKASQDTDAHLVLEGYKTTFGTNQDEGGSDSDDDEYLPSTIRF